MEDHLKIIESTQGAVGQAWFTQIAHKLINETDFIINDKPYKFQEIEFYYYGGEHLDPFAHKDPVQLTCGKWYFHRDEGAYRGGSFKGLDISFGPEGIFGGVLIRTIEAPDGAVINGCSLCVDHMLKQTGFEDVAALDGVIDERPVWTPESPLALRPAAAPRETKIYSTARVGLTLKMMFRNPEMPRYIMRRYRFLTDPTIKKGKLHTVIALHQEGETVESIKALTASPLKTIGGYIEAYNEGLELDSFKSFRGKALKTADLCRLHGAFFKHYGDEDRAS